MSILKVLGAALAVSALAATQAFALTVTNRDTSQHIVLIQKGDTETEYALPAGESMEGACEDGCTVRLAGAEGELAAQDADKIVIQDGTLQREDQ